MGILRVLSESYPMNTYMTGFRFFIDLCMSVVWTKVAPALEWLKDVPQRNTGQKPVTKYQTF